MQLNPTWSAGYCLTPVEIKHTIRVMLYALWHVIWYGPIVSMLVTQLYNPILSLTVIYNKYYKKKENKVNSQANTADYSELPVWAWALLSAEALTINLTGYTAA